MSGKFNISQLRTDPAKEKEGVWIDAGAGLRLKIARLNSPPYQQALAKGMRPLREALRGVGEIKPEDLADVTRRAMAKHILLGWENLQDEKKGPDGQPIMEIGEDGIPTPVLEDVIYSPEKAYELLKVQDFAEIVTNYANNMQNFRSESRKVDEGNSVPASSGS